MGRKKLMLIGGAIAIALISYLGWKFTARSGYESAEYTIIASDDAIEIRRYPELMLVTTPMQPAAQGDDGSFMRLFGYISGGNEQSQKVAMTTPVFMERGSESSQDQMAFVIPKQVAAEGIPQPSGDGVRIRSRRGGEFAVIRFAGRINPTIVAAKEKELRRWVAEQGRGSEGSAEVAGYDPPWTPGPLRRNELLIRLDHPDELQ